VLLTKQQATVTFFPVTMSRPGQLALNREKGKCKREKNPNPTNQSAQQFFMCYLCGTHILFHQSLDINHYFYESSGAKKVMDENSERERVKKI
jgi:hypothetical protein